MLISHRKQFIYTKTMKTASSSIEIYFEPYCFPEGEWEDDGGRPETVLETGIIGGRGKQRPKRWFNHMPAKRIRNQVDSSIWNNYFKFTAIRNPFDKMISGFLMYCRRRQRYTPWQKARARCLRLFNCGQPIDRATGSTEIAQFRSWVKQGGVIADRDKYFITGEVCVDFFIRFENLAQDIENVCNRISVPFEPSRIQQRKAKKRHHSIPIREYYDSETEAIVREAYAWEFEHFGYDMPGPDVY